MSLSDVLRDRSADLARDATFRLYEAHPELIERWGDEGRRKCTEDLAHNFEHLQGALSVGRPSLFQSYMEWVAAVLGARNIPVRHVLHSLTAMESALRDTLGEHEAAPALSMIEVGRAAVLASGEDA